ncbi:hypothetical protein FRB95_000631 [Tulasnella sp. JGI-2019a]|nr:hypothetical protein FRB95_000631 [Tulasnella sp. JGI-2019a]
MARTRQTRRISTDIQQRKLRIQSFALAKLSTRQSPSQPIHDTKTTSDYSDTPLPGILLALCFEYLSRKDLVAVAAACKFWLHIALDVLLRTHEVSLSHVFDRTSFLKREESANPGAPNAAGPLPSVGSVGPKEWMLFLHRYAHKVTHLRINATLDRHASYFLRQLLEIYGGTLCANVKSVHVQALTCTDNNIPPSLPIIFGSSVTCITIGDHNSTEEINATCQEVARAYADITKLTIPRKIINLSQFHVDFSLFSRLMVVDLGAISWEGWVSLGRHCTSTLEEIIIRIRDGGDNWERYPLPASYVDSNINRVDIVTFPLVTKFTFNHLHVVLQSSMPSLQSLLVDEFWDKDGGAFGVLSDRSPLLRDLMVNFNCREVLPRTLQAISTIQGLKSLRLGGSCWMVLVDDLAMDLLARRLIHLRILSMQIKCKHSSKLTYDSLLAVFRHCNAIEELHLPIDITSFDASDVVGGTTASQSTSLRSLTLSCGPPPLQIRQTARNLSTWCPNVTEFKVMQHCLRMDEPVDLDDDLLEYNETKEPFSDVAAKELVKLFYMFQVFPEGSVEVVDQLILPGIDAVG